MVNTSHLYSNLHHSPVSISLVHERRGLTRQELRLHQQIKDFDPQGSSDVLQCLAHGRLFPTLTSVTHPMLAARPSASWAIPTGFRLRRTLPLMICRSRAAICFYSRPVGRFVIMPGKVPRNFDTLSFCCLHHHLTRVRELQPVYSLTCLQLVRVHKFI